MSDHVRSTGAKPLDSNDNSSTLTRYEFSEGQNQIVRDLARKMSVVGLFLMINGFALLAMSVMIFITLWDYEVLLHIFPHIVVLIIGSWTRHAAKSFHKIVDSEGNDIPNLMNALENLQKLYRLKYIILMITLVFIALGVLLIFAGGIFEGLSQK